MTVRFYRSILIGSSLAWFLVGLHVPMLHQMSFHGHTPPHWGVAIATAILVLAGAAGLIALLRARSQSGSP
jgi:hypothetical protein